MPLTGRRERGRSYGTVICIIVQQVFSSPAMLVTVLLTLGVIFVNGWTDAPNAIATCIATRCITSGQPS